MILIENYEKKTTLQLKIKAYLGRYDCLDALLQLYNGLLQEESMRNIVAEAIQPVQLRRRHAQMARRQILLVGNKHMPQLEKLCCSHTHFSSKRNVSQCSTFFTFRYFGYPENITMVPSLASVYCVPLKGTWRFLEC